MDIEKLFHRLNSWKTVADGGTLSPAGMRDLRADCSEALEALTTMQDREATLIRVLRDAREAIASLETEALHVYPLREELLSDIDEALGTSGLVERS